MSTIAVNPFSGTYRAQPAPSTFAFAVRHSGVFWYPRLAVGRRRDALARRRRR